MRPRIKVPYPETTVGCNVFVAGQEVLSDTGLDLTTLSFWNVAHMADASAASTVSSWNVMAEYTYTHHKFHANVPDLKLHAKRGIISDVSLAHIEYPYDTTYDLDDNHTITVQGLHVYQSMPHVSYGAVVFITVVKDTFHYTLMSKLSDDDSNQLLDYIVQALEGIATIPKEETMLQAVERIFGE
jgi:hypothetical protein